ncbi:bifunctional adenosylcobinamide kinase/adenosylcobinamide-phosphate guanylyltransferase [Niveibacterium sp. SC-1]|uniref:bifunctional adenosylcobinamide kinase/adenosylcobinamide-phosphate guanylyltransferase n=1 Tax=Niveibacterium sp. SC-1 TaxID=3135646 RepID=UPI00311DF9C6
MIELVLGGARSGKSRHASERANASGLPVIYVATAQGLDEEMRARIAQHKAERPAAWKTIEAPLDLPRALVALVRPGRCVLVDCLTLWLSNVMLAAGEDTARRDAEIDALLGALARVQGRIIVVSNEVGMGLVPDTPLGRAFRDEQGRLNQKVAALARRVVFVAAGLPLLLKE